ncbi:MAG: pyruvate kinase [Bacilli bacterium]
MLYNIEKKTKIVATIGPATDNYQMIVKLVKAGMNVMRINFSHGSYAEHLNKVLIAKRLEKEHGYFLPVMLDTRGPEIRCGHFEEGGVEIIRHQKVRISMTPLLGNREIFSIDYPGLFDDVKVGDHLKIDDGKLELLITEKDNEKRQLIVKALNTHVLKDRKGINVPFARLSIPFISARDEADLQWGCEQEVAFIAASFTRRKQDILDIKAILEKYGSPHIQIIAKIENRESLDNFEEILAVADGIMVARGDLGVEVPPEIVPVIQERLIRRCRQVGKTVITATQMLDSMQTHPIPTRAEVSDVATAIKESTDAIMLSAESASGEYPLESVEMQAKIAATIEKHLDYTELAAEAYCTSEQNNSDAIANSVANTANLIKAAAIFCFSETGLSGMRIAKSRPACPIICLTQKKNSAIKLALQWGVTTMIIHQLPQLIEDMEAIALIKAHDLKIKPGSPIIITGGTPTGTGGTNFMRIVKVNQIREI